MVTQSKFWFHIKISPGGPNMGQASNMLQFWKMQDYLQFLEIFQCVPDHFHMNSELTKRFFRDFWNFLTPGLHLRKTHISRVMKEFCKIVVILAIFQKSTIFQCPLKSVDESWHRRYKKSDLQNNSNLPSKSFMKKSHHVRLMVKNCWGGGGLRAGPECPIMRNYQRHENWMFQRRKEV